MNLLNDLEIKKAVNLLDNNEVVILPTDTIYGLSAVVNKTNEQKINLLKTADIKKPLIILISDIDDVKHDINYSKEDLGKLNSVEPTTVIFPLKDNKDITIAIRIVKRLDIKKIIKEVGPIFSTSVNTHNEKPLSSKTDLEAFLKKDNVFFAGELISSPSRIYNSITKEYIR